MDLEAASKYCHGCDACKPPQDFHRHLSSRDGLYHICKDCRRAYNAEYYTRRTKPPPTPATTANDMSDGDDGCVTPPRAADTGSTAIDALYVIKYDFDPCGTMGLKIGRAACVETRVRQLEASHNFRLIVLATFPGLGHLEARVHAMLSESRAREGRGREWFCAPLDTVLHTIALATRERAGLQFEGPKS